MKLNFELAFFWESTISSLAVVIPESCVDAGRLVHDIYIISCNNGVTRPCVGVSFPAMLSM